MTANPFAGFKRDANEAVIVEYLRRTGRMVWPIHGQGVPDLLVWSARAHAFWLFEVKNGRGRITEAQARAFRVFENEKAPMAIVRSVDEAAEWCGRWEATRRSPHIGDGG